MTDPVGENEEEFTPVDDDVDAGELSPELENREVEAPSLDEEIEEPVLAVEEIQTELDEEEFVRTLARMASNVYSTRTIVYAHRNLFQPLGEYGDSGHQAGAGDHTYHSTHRGKYGYPTQGVVHAIDIGASYSVLLSLEYWIRREIRFGRLKGLKYFNVLNRHWNYQTWTNYNMAKGGTLRPKYSVDHHLHLSFENGSIDGNLLSRYLAYRTGATVSGDDMPSPADLWNYKIGSPTLYTGTRAAGDLLKQGYANSLALNEIEAKVTKIEAALARIEAALRA
jgi:hypothetical protein